MLHKITKMDGIVLGIVENPLYVKYSDNGSLIEAYGLSDAIGVTYQSTPYNLVGKDKIAGAETVVVTDIDEGTLLFNMQNDILNNGEAMLELMFEADMNSMGGQI